MPASAKSTKTTNSSSNNTLNNGASQSTRTLVTVLLLLFLTPIGFFVMWFWSKWAMWVKLLITGLLVFWFILVFVFVAIFLVALNPGELTQRSRDAQRLTDLSSINQAINAEIKANEDVNLCGKYEVPCLGVSTKQSTAVDGNGWVMAPLKTLAKLPTDPINSVDQNRAYIYCSDGLNWELNTLLESDKQEGRMMNDKGDNDSLYETGSDLTLCPN